MLNQTPYQGFSSLPPLSLKRKTLVQASQVSSKSGRFTMYQLCFREGWQCRLCHLCVEGNQHAFACVARRPLTKRFTARYFMYYTYGIRHKRHQLWSNRSDAPENILASVDFLPV